MLKNYTTETGSKIILKNMNEEFEVDLYSQEGLAMLSNLWVKTAAEFKLMYELTWMGRPIIQFGSDMIMLQQLIWETKPDIFIETGIAHGGSLIYTASLFELMGNDGQVIGIDVEIRPHNRTAIEQHSMYKRIKMIEGSSIAQSTIDALEKLLESNKTVTVMLDSNHSRDHVLEELRLYSKYVTKGSYLIVQDGAQEWVCDIPRGKPEWKEDNPLAAIDIFLKENSDFVIDDKYTRLGITQSPNGYLRKIK
jgi:cephalosporin hydroxylase